MPNDPSPDQDIDTAAPATNRQRRTLIATAIAGVTAAAVLIAVSSTTSGSTTPHLTLVAAPKSEMLSAPSPLETKFQLASSANLPSTTSTAYEMVPDDLDATAKKLGSVLEVTLAKTDFGYEARTKTATLTLDKMGTWAYSSTQPLEAPCAVGPDIPRPDKATGVQNSAIPLDVPETATQCVTPVHTTLDDVNTKKKAAALFAKLGARELSKIVNTSGAATAEMLIDGVSTGVSWSARFDADGKLVSASGIAATAKSLGSYKVISSKDAVAHLSDANWTYDNQIDAPSAAMDSPAQNSTSIPAKFDTAGAVPNTGPVVSVAPPVSQADSVPPSPPTAPPSTQVLPQLTDTRPIVIERYKPITVKLTKARVVLQPRHTGLNGKPRVLLLPAWEFSASNGSVWFTIALQSADVSFSAAPLGAVQRSDPKAAVPALSPVESVRVKVVGMTEADAVKFIESEGFTARVTIRDDESFAVTMDYRSDRVNLVVNANVVMASGVG